VYDPYQLHKMATDLRKEGLGWFKEFSQGKDRLVADKQFYDLVMSRRIAHGNDPTMRQHVQNAAAKTEGDARHLRFVKKADRLKIDALVAASMAAFQCLRLNL
jgi:phage terminase large subunit-like protein